MAKEFFAVLADATVYRCRTVGEAGRIDGALIATEKDLSKLPTPLIVKLFNRASPERPVTRFADRATAEKRIDGVLDLLAKPSPLAGEAPEKPAKAEKAPKVPKAPKEAGESTGKRGAKPKDIAPETVARVVALKAEGKSWEQICGELGEPLNFIQRVRPILRTLDPSLVKQLGPGSPNYGKGPQPKVKREPGAPRAPRVKKARAGNGVPVEAF